MFKQLLGAAPIVFALSTSSIAGDENAIIQSQSVYEWEGFYAGLHAGGGLGHVDWSDAPGNPFFAQPSDVVSHSPSGAALGFFAGHNWQRNNYILGIEAGALFGELTDNSIYRSGYVSTPNEFPNSTTISTIITAGPRIGVVSDYALFYVKGGIAAAEVKLNQQTGPDLNDPATDINTTVFHPGIYIGVGVEVEMNPGWALGIEYNHIMLYDQVHPWSVPAISESGNVLSSGVSVDIVTARLIKSF